jgi:hypothetical protein
MSTCSSPNSSSSYSLTEEPQIPTMDNVVKQYNTEALIEYLQKQELMLDDDDFKLFRREKITGLSFLNFTEEELQECGFKKGPSKSLAVFIEDLKQQKIRCFSSYKTIEEMKAVFHKYKVNGEKITSIRQFSPGENHIFLLVLVNMASVEVCSK